MIPQRHQARVLVMLLALWAGVAAWTLLETDPTERVPLTNVGGTVTGDAAGGHDARKDALTVNLSLLQSTRAQRAAAPTSSKNIFELDRSGDLVEDTPAPPSEEPPEEGDPSVYGVQPRPGWAELGEFRYLGYFEVGDRGHRRGKVALLSKRDVLHTVRPGEMIGSDILVTGITSSTVTLRHTGSRMEQQLVLSDDGAPAVPAF